MVESATWTLKRKQEAKPPFEQMVPKEVIEAKVTDYLKKCSALDQFWQMPIIASQLQAEMDRMAKGSKDPATLNELFAALDNDPFLIAECLARPVLADRLVTEAYPDTDERSCILEKYELNFTNLWTADQDQVEHFFHMPEASMESGCDTTWLDALISSSGMPEARYDHAAVWTGAEMIIWGGWSGTSGIFNSGVRYYPSTDSWTSTSTGDNCPSARGGPSFVWTGTEMVIWGGGGYDFLKTGGRYNPVTDSWTSTQNVGAPIGRCDHAAVWSGTEMIIWGGMVTLTYPYETYTGGHYSPFGNTWAATSLTNCPSIREYHTAVWTGAEMIVWGGLGSGTLRGDGGRYNPSSGSWTGISTGTNCPSARDRHTSVWTGSKMIVWGGYDSRTNPNYTNNGGIYDPATDKWSTTSTWMDCLSARYRHTSVWTGGNMIVWGGKDNNSSLDTGGVYDPAGDSWAATPTGGYCPSARYNHSALWLDSGMAVWGGEYPATASGGMFVLSSYHVEQDQVVCEGVDFVLSVVPASSGASFQWYEDGVAIPGATSSEVTVSEPRTYYATVDDGGGTICSSSSFNPSFAGPYPTISGPTSICATANLNTQSFSSYQWYLNGTLIPGAESQAYQASSPGTYSVKVTDGTGCRGTSPDFALSMAAPSMSNNSASDLSPYTNNGVRVGWSTPTWNDSGGTRSFSVLRNGTVIATGISQGTTAYSDTRGSTGVSYLYQVAATNGCWEVAITAGVTAADLANPVSPQVFSTNGATDLSACADNGVYISWAAPSPWGDGGYGTRSYTVLRDSVPIATGVSESVLSYSDTTGEQGVSYFYQVIAINGYSLTSTTAGANASDEGASTLGEVAGSAWSGNSFVWSTTATAIGYKLYRGLQSDLTNLKTTTNEGCVRYDGTSTSVNCAADNPGGQTGRFYWYLVTAYDGSCEGTAGEGSGFLRNLSSSATCP